MKININKKAFLFSSRHVLWSIIKSIIAQIGFVHRLATGLTTGTTGVFPQHLFLDI